MSQSSATDSIRIKAGKRVCELIQDGAFHFDRLSTYFAPATGPRWLAATGFDLALMKSDLLGRLRPVTLIGASAGAWRFAAWTQPEPEKSYRALMDAYINTSYKRMETPATILQSMRNIINAYLEDDALPFALANKKYRLAIITARAKHLVSSETKWVQQMGLGMCFLLNAINRSYLYHFAERVVFYNGPKPPHFCLRSDFQGRYISLTEINFKHVVMASGAIPVVIAGVRNIYGAPTGIYRDGGLIDYHLTHPYAAKADDITLFFNHQERIIPGWLDKKLSYRHPPDHILDNVLMVYPSEEFVARLPGGKVPDRDDFTTFIDDPATRIENWRHAVQMAESLGEQFLELVESGKIRHMIKSF
jgi:hypothetical protein